MYYTILYCNILYYSILYYTILYYTLLYLTILYLPSLARPSLAPRSLASPSPPQSQAPCSLARTLTRSLSLARSLDLRSLGPRPSLAPRRPPRICERSVGGRPVKICYGSEGAAFPEYIFIYTYTLDTEHCFQNPVEGSTNVVRYRCVGFQEQLTLCIFEARDQHYIFVSSTVMPTEVSPSSRSPLKQEYSEVESQTLKVDRP